MRSLALAAVLVLAGCDTIEVGPRPSADDEAAAGDTTVDERAIDERACAELTRGECMRAVHCTLQASSSGPSRAYVCRDARGNCEIGLRQIDADRDRCADREGCAWSEGSCYCACRGAGHAAVPDGDEAAPCDCECGGGPPPGCRAR